MSQQANDNFKLNAPKLFDQRSGKFVSGVFQAYANRTEALASIPMAYRSEFLYVYLMIGSLPVEHWFYGGIADVNLVARQNPCDYYLDPTTGNPWLTPAAANTYITANSVGCKTAHITILSYNLVAGQQEYWYKNGTDLEAKLGNDSKGVNSTAFGDLGHYTNQENSSISGESCFVGIRYDTTNVVQGSGTIAITASGTPIANGKTVALISLSGRFNPVVGTTSGLSGNTFNISGTIVWKTGAANNTPVYIDYDTKVIDIPALNAAVYRATFAIGLGANAWGWGAMALGTGSSAEGYGAFAVAGGIARGIYAIAMGGQALSDYSYAGPGSVTHGPYSFAFGEGTHAYALSLGFGAFVLSQGGDGAFATGYQLKNDARSSFLTGRYGLTQRPGERVLSTDERQCYNFPRGGSQLTESILKAETTDNNWVTMLYHTVDALTINEFILNCDFTDILDARVLVKQVDENAFTFPNSCNLPARPDVVGTEYGVFNFGHLIFKDFNTTEILGGTHIGGNPVQVSAVLEFGSSTATSESWAVRGTLTSIGIGLIFRVEVKGSPNKRLWWDMYIRGKEFNANDQRSCP